MGKARPAPDHPFNVPRGPEHVPTVEELVTKGLALPSGYLKPGHPTHYTISPEGQELIYAAQKRNAEFVKEQLEELRWIETQKALGW